MKPKDYPKHLQPQHGETLPDDEASDARPFAFGAWLDSLPSKCARMVETHVGNHHPPIVPDDEGAFPEDVVACVRDRHGLIGYAEDGSGRRLDGTLGAFGKPEKPEKPKPKGGRKKGAGRSQSAPSPEATEQPLDVPPPPQSDAGDVSG